MTNYTILQRNVLGSLESDEAQKAFLWACDLKGADRYQYRAEAFARAVDRLGPQVADLIDAAERIFREQKGFGLNADEKADLHRFVMKRHSAYRFPGIKSDYGG